MRGRGRTLAAAVAGTAILALSAGCGSGSGGSGGELVVYNAQHEDLVAAMLKGFAKETGILGSLIKRVITWILAIGGYLIYLRMKPTLVPKAHAPAAEESDAGESLAV